MFADEEECKLTAIDEVFGGHSLTVFYCHECGMVNSAYQSHRHHLVITIIIFRLKIYPLCTVFERN